MERIVGGTMTQPGEYPWMVSVHEKHGYRFKHICGGTILNENYIVTAAHCIDYPTSPRRYQIYTGVHKLSKKYREPAASYKISQVIVHEDYDKDTWENDIALLRTKEPIEIEGSSGYVNGICLPYSDKDPNGWSFVAGWGYTKQDGEISDILKVTKLPLVTRKICNDAYEAGDYPILDTQICAGVVGKDSCQLDSGGPLMQKSKKGVYQLIGIVSYGIGCGQPDYPGVYTKVSSFMDWLEENMD